MRNALSFLDDWKRYGTDPDIQKIREALDDLGHPERSFPLIHIAGTNGKGSTGTFLASILHEAGYTVGHFSSPHVQDFRERMRINGNNPSENSFITAANTLKEKMPFLRNHESLKAFTLQMFASFLLFQQEKVDVAIIEVGIGGRTDPTNVISPSVTMITPIDFDHTARLGNTLSEIAWQKAGIIKKEVPVVIGVQQKEAMDVLLNEASELDAPVFTIDDKTKLLDESGGSISFFYIPTQTVFKTTMGGVYQKDNAACALIAAKLFAGEIDEKTLQKGIENASIPARLQRIQDHPAIIVDGAHNVHGIRAFVQSRKQVEGSIGIIGMMADKLTDEVLSLWRKAFEKVFFVPVYDERSWDPQKIKEDYFPMDPSVFAFDSWQEALQHAKESNPEEIYVMGSFYLAGDVLNALEEKE